MMMVYWNDEVLMSAMLIRYLLSEVDSPIEYLNRISPHPAVIRFSLFSPRSLHQIL